MKIIIIKDQIHFSKNGSFHNPICIEEFPQTKFKIKKALIMLLLREMKEQLVFKLQEGCYEVEVWVILQQGQIISIIVSSQL